MGPPLPPRRPRPLHVTIVADSPETRDGLEAYLQRAGVTTNGTKQLDRLPDMTPPFSSVVLLFPDDFRLGSVLVALDILRAQRPRTLPVLVTKEPKKFEALPTPKGSLAPLLVPKPVWGWTILDAIRARLDSELLENERTR
jgi:hypothetical protein